MHLLLNCFIIFIAIAFSVVRPFSIAQIHTVLKSKFIRLEETMLLLLKLLHVPHSLFQFYSLLVMEFLSVKVYSLQLVNLRDLCFPNAMKGKNAVQLYLLRALLLWNMQYVRTPQGRKPQKCIKKKTSEGFQTDFQLILYSVCLRLCSTS